MRKHDERALSLAASREDWEPSPMLGSAAARDIWRDIVAGVTADHFAAGDELALVLLCDSMARLVRVRDAIDKLPLVSKAEDTNRSRRLLNAERMSLTAMVTTLIRQLRLVPAGRRRVDALRTDMPTRNRAKGTGKGKAPGADLFAC